MAKNGIAENPDGARYIWAGQDELVVVMASNKFAKTAGNIVINGSWENLHSDSQGSLIVKTIEQGLWQKPCA